MALPPNSVYPIFEGRIFVDDDRIITDTNLLLEPVDMWVPASVERGQFRSGDINFSGVDDKPKLRVEMQNTSLTAVANVEVVATVFTEDGKPVTSSQTIIEYAAPRSGQDIVFTWPNPLEKTIRSCVVPADVMLAIDLSGSMNNDGDNPPQPVTDTLQAAGKFASSLKSRDQIALVTFATKADLIASLSEDNDVVAATITSLEIDPIEETGFTNTLDAFQVASTEFASERQNPNARKVLVLLTDGLPTTSGDEDIVTNTALAAQALSQSGVEVYAIGLGQGVDKQFVQSLASGEENIYFAPSGAELESIYQEITTSLCESGATKIEVIAKTEAVFTPLR
jgi:Mg-chelatase subunit ChlD